MDGWGDQPFSELGLFGDWPNSGCPLPKSNGWETQEIGVGSWRSPCSGWLVFNSWQVFAISDPFLILFWDGEKVKRDPIQRLYT